MAQQYDEAYVTGPGSYYAQLQVCLRLGLHADLPVQIPVATYSFGRNGDTGEAVLLQLSLQEQHIGLKQAQALVQSMRSGSSQAATGVEYIQQQSAEQLRNGYAWVFRHRPPSGS